MKVSNWLYNDGDAYPPIKPPKPPIPPKDDPPGGEGGAEG